MPGTSPLLAIDLSSTVRLNDEATQARIRTRVAGVETTLSIRSQPSGSTARTTDIKDANRVPSEVEPILAVPDALRARRIGPAQKPPKRHLGQ